MHHDRWEKGLFFAKTGLQFEPVMTYVINNMTYVMFIYFSTRLDQRVKGFDTPMRGSSEVGCPRDQGTNGKETS